MNFDSLLAWGTLRAFEFIRNYNTRQLQWNTNTSFFNYSHVNIQYIFDAFIHERVTDKVVIEELDNSMSLSDEYTISLYKDREYVYIPTRHSNNKHEASSNVM